MRFLKTKVYKYVTSLSKKVYIVNEYINKCDKTIKMKPGDVKDNTYIDSMELYSNKNLNDKDPKFKVGDFVRISKHKNIFAKGYTPNWYEEVFVIKKS